MGKPRAPDAATQALMLEQRGMVWKSYATRSKKAGNSAWHKIGVLDTETDPFDKSLPDMVIEPFTWGLMTVDTYADDFQKFAGWDTVPQNPMQTFIDHLETLTEPHLIYAHNGGKFDFTFLIPWFDDIHLINGRIAEARIGIHVFRDSFLLFPESLGRSGEKEKFDYRKMARARRNLHMAEILRYQKQDCHALLHSYILPFIKEFGLHITMPSAAWKQMIQVMSDHDPDFRFHKLGSAADSSYRKYYAGGRVECFESGILRSENGFKVFDINGAYAGAMRNMSHPIGLRCEVGDSLSKPYDFARITAQSDGALFLHQRADMDDLGYLAERQLRFPSTAKETFFATRHEIEAGLETGRLKIHRVHMTRYFPTRTNFAPFIDHFTAKRNHAKSMMKQLGMDHPDYNLWDIRNLFYKRVQNGTYGKTAQDPRTWEDYAIVRPEQGLPSDEWKVKRTAKSRFTPELWFIAKPSDIAEHSFFNVACGASITGAVRATLFRGICASTRPVYCDTDSIICEDFHGEVDDGKLGAMKLEAEGDVLAVAGKKMYALADTRLWTRNKKEATELSARFLKSRRVDGAIPWEGGYIPCIKFACKGVQITPAVIFKIANGGTHKHLFETPTISYSGAQRYQTRTVRATAHIEPRKRRVGL